MHSVYPDPADRNIRSRREDYPAERNILEVLEVCEVFELPTALLPAQTLASPRYRTRQIPTARGRR